MKYKINKPILVNIQRKIKYIMRLESIHQINYKRFNYLFNNKRQPRQLSELLSDACLINYDLNPFRFLEKNIIIVNFTKVN